MNIIAYHQGRFITDTGEGIRKDVIDGSPRVGVALEEVGDRYKVVGNGVNEDCVGGVCPIK